MYPFLYWNNLEGGDRKFYVMIAEPFDYTTEDVRWWADKRFNYLSTPDMDLLKSERSFDTELEALRFIRQWWIDNPPS
jgi:hypothetical protein